MHATSLRHLGPLYHDYAFFGADSVQMPGIYAANQAAKEPILRAYLAWALAKLPPAEERDDSFLELFCADGYYAMLATKLGVRRSVGLDNNQDKLLDQARAVAEALEVRSVTFAQRDVRDAHQLGRFDVVANIGGLYHVEDPEAVLEMSYRMARQFLLVQTVVSLASDADDYFETPAPGLTWGCRYSRQSFDRLIDSKGWRVVDRHFNELTGNERLEDRGSVYYLVQKEPN